MSGKVSAKYKKQKLSSDVLAEILRSDDEDELVEFINNSFPKSKSGPGAANNNKKRTRTNKPRDDDVLHEIDLSPNGSALGSQGPVSKYDLSSNGESIIVGNKPTVPSRFLIAAGLFVSFFALGIAVAMLGPTLLDLQHQVKCSFQAMSTVFTARSFGYMLGSIIAGWLYHRWNGYFLLTVSCMVISLGLTITPLTRSFITLVIAIITQGLALGSLDTGANVMILNLYGKNSDAQMQGLHAMFGLGAFIAPLLAGPFLSNHSSLENIIFTNTTTNITNTAIIINSTVTSHSKLTVNTTAPIPIPENVNMSLKWPFWISAVFFVLPLVVFVPAGLKNSHMSQNSDTTLDALQYDKGKAFRGFTLVLLFVFLLLYVGMEVAIGGLIFSFAFKHGILKSKSLAAYLTSTFWGSFGIARFLGIPLAMHVRAFVILIIDIVGCLVGSLILVFLSTSVHAWLWAGVAILGASMASVFPSTMTWADTFLHITGKSASVLVVGGTVGEMTIPLMMGTMMERNGPEVFLQSIVVIVVLVMLIFLVLAVLSRRLQKEEIDKFGIHYHKVMEQKGNHRIFSKGDEIVQLLEDSSEIFSTDN